MATPAASAPAQPSPHFPGGSGSASPQGSECSEESAWDSGDLRSYAGYFESEGLAAVPVNPSLLQTLNGLLLEVYTMLRPKPVDYEQRNSLVDVFNKMTKEIFDSNNGFPVVKAFGSFTMDLFTPRSDLDLSLNFSGDTENQYDRKEKISAIRKISKVLYSHRGNGTFCGVLPVTSARVPVLNVIDRGTGIECDISVENKDGMTRSMVFKFISSVDERFQILSYLMKFWAKMHHVNCSKEQTMSSISITAIVAFHLQTRHPPILPAFSSLLKDGSDFVSVERNILLFKGFGSKNKESVAELFISLMSKLVSVESLWEHGLCASNFEASWIAKTWEKGVGNLSVEDFLDRSQNLARSVGKVQMQKICKCLRECSITLSHFMRSKIDALKLKTLLFGCLNPDQLVSKPRLKRVKRKRKSKLSRESRSGFEKRAKHAVNHTEPHHHANASTTTGPPAPAPAPTPATAPAPAPAPASGPAPAPARVKPPTILYQRPTQFSTQFVHVPRLGMPPPILHQYPTQFSTQSVHIPGLGMPPPILHQYPTQFSTQFVHRPGLGNVPSGFGYGLPLQLPVDPYLRQGLLGQPPANLIPLNYGIQLPPQGPLLPMTWQHTPGYMIHPQSRAYYEDLQLQQNQNRFLQRR